MSDGNRRAGRPPRRAALRRAAVGRAPASLRRLLRAANARRIRLRRRIEQRRSPVRVTGDEVAAALARVGLGPGDAVFFQAAMGSFGEIEGGVDTVLRALDDTTGGSSLLAMPGFPFRAGALEHLRADPVFDVRATPSAMGAVSERFRTLPGSRRSLHPTHSVCARGDGADALVAGHERAETPFGYGTPFAGLLEREACQVWFGTDVHAFTIYHAFECMLGSGFPIPVFLDDPVEARCVDWSGAERRVATLVHDPAVAAYRVRSQARWRVREELLTTGVMRSVHLGRGEILMTRMPALFDALAGMLDRGLTIYDIDIAGGRRDG